MPLPWRLFGSTVNLDNLVREKAFFIDGIAKIQGVSPFIKRLSSRITYKLYDFQYS